MPRSSFSDLKAAGVFSAPVIAIMLVVVVVMFFLTGRLGIPGPIFWITALAMVGWVATIRYRRKMEKRLGRKIKGDHELTSISSWMEVESKEADNSKRL